MSSGRTITDNCFVVDSPQALSFCRVEPPLFQPQVEVLWQLSAALVGVAVERRVPEPAGDPRQRVLRRDQRRGPARRSGRPLSGGATTVTINNVIDQQQAFEDRYYQTDLRVIRNFRFGGTRLQVMFDMYNMFNNAGILAINTRYGTSYRRPTTILDARILKLGAQINF